MLVVAVVGEHHPLARELREHRRERLDLLRRDRRDDVDAVLRARGPVEDLLLLHEREEPPRELRGVVAALLVDVHLELGAVGEVQQRHARASRLRPRPDHVAHDHGVHERVVGDRQAELLAGGGLDLVDPLGDEGVRRARYASTSSGPSRATGSSRPGRSTRRSGCRARAGTPARRRSPALHPRREHRVAAHAGQIVVGGVVGLVEDPRARGELPVALPVVGAELEDQPVAHAVSPPGSALVEAARRGAA